MHDIEQSLRLAWARIRKILLRDPDELHRRLARRRLALMQRPPRAWCIALRASDRRIDDSTAIIERVTASPHPGLTESGSVLSSDAPPRTTKSFSPSPRRPLALRSTEKSRWRFFVPSGTRDRA